MNLAEKIRDFVGYDSFEEEYDVRPSEQRRGTSHIADAHPAVPALRITLVKLVTVADGRTIIDELAGGKAVVFSVAGTPRAQSRRLLDFVCGGLYAYDGWVEHIGVDVYLLLPQGIEILYNE